ncbi:hypothetical protein MJO29_005088 [Puccinia striiformis f. sp. tritici]|nr:hypothetical protein MJO29_005088 [Puccinia striiformis f. sp. tritici]
MRVTADQHGPSKPPIWVTPPSSSIEQIPERSSGWAEKSEAAANQSKLNYSHSPPSASPSDSTKNQQDNCRSTSVE